MILVLPWPPSANNRLIPARGRLIATQEYRDWKELAARHLLGQLIGRPQFRGAVSVFINAHPPDNRRRRDLDNVLKAALDALQRAQVIEDDYNVVQLTIHRNVVVKGGELRIELTAVHGGTLETAK